MKNSISTSLLIMLLVATGGCATHIVRSGGNVMVANGIYPATRTDIHLLVKGSIFMEGGVIMGYVVAPIGFLLDIPVSLLTDTVFLPMDVYCLASSNELCGAPSLAKERQRRWRASHCKVCSYDLTGNESGVCPECGTKIEKP